MNTRVLTVSRVFLLDEPGANLHSKAQGDVLKLVNKLAKETSTVVYTTHSPQMIEHPKLYRVHAVQRDGELDDSPTSIIDAHRLGAASTDTLSPVLSAMGADLSQHQVIKKDNNVLLEEMSGYYYLTSFWKLTGATKQAHFIAATGVNKLETLANMFRGWGLNFVVAIDDDKQGRDVYKNLKRELCGDDEKIAAECLVKLPCGTGIEDVFDAEDFRQFVLKDESVSIGGTVTEFLKTAGRSKPVLAFHFALAVSNGDLTLAKFTNTTHERIVSTVKAIETLLSKTGK
jgi:energy-coupling factor transporter ATP-binding protein EcfA2